MKTPLQKLIKISNRLGSDRSLVLGAFGNTSVKTDDGQSMYIKASGTCLKEMTADRGWRKLKTQKIIDILNDSTFQQANSAESETKISTSLIKACCDDKPDTVKPSIESFFHAILDPCVVHLHPEAVLAVACANDGQQYIEELFRRKKHPPLWIPYVGLGYASAKEMQHHITAYEKQYSRRPNVLVIQNHGLVISESSPKAALHRTEKTMKVFEKVLVKLNAKHNETEHPEAIRIAHDIRAAIVESTEARINTAHFHDSTVTAFMNLPRARELCQGDPMTNDEAAFTHGPPLWLEESSPEYIADAIETIAKTRRPVPRGFLVKNAGLFVATPSRDLNMIADICRAYMRIRATADQLGGPRPIPRNLLDQYAEPTQ